MHSLNRQPRFVIVQHQWRQDLGQILDCQSQPLFPGFQRRFKLLCTPWNHLIDEIGPIGQQVDQLLAKDRCIGQGHRIQLDLVAVGQPVDLGFQFSTAGQGEQSLQTTARFHRGPFGGVQQAQRHGISLVGQGRIAGQGQSAAGYRDFRGQVSKVPGFDARFLPARIGPTGECGGCRRPQVFAHGLQIGAAGQGLSGRVDDLDVHLQVCRNVRRIEYFQGNPFARDLGQNFRDRRIKTSLAKFYPPQDFACRIGHGDERPAIIFRQAFDQGDDLLFQQPGDQPAQAIRVDLIETLLGHDQCQAILLGTGIKPVFDRQLRISHGQ